MTHTPAPWEINWGNNPLEPHYCTIYSKPGDHTTVEHIAQLGSSMSENWKANARVMAAAPKMLAALEYYLELQANEANVWVIDHMRTLDQMVSEAVAEATGTERQVAE